jgi:hypothetical protein
VIRNQILTPPGEPEPGCMNATMPRFDGLIETMSATDSRFLSGAPQYKYYAGRRADECSDTREGLFLPVKLDSLNTMTILSGST